MAAAAFRGGHSKKKSEGLYAESPLPCWAFAIPCKLGAARAVKDNHIPGVYFLLAQTRPRGLSPKAMRWLAGTLLGRCSWVVGS